MNRNHFVSAFFCAALIVPSCTKNASVSEKVTPGTAKIESLLAQSNGATQISGVGAYATLDECDYVGMGADYAVKLTGDLQGCHFTYIEAFNCSPSGTYREEGREYFVGTYKGQAGTFRTTYKFESKYTGCAVNGAALGAEIFGRCQHPLVKGTGDGVFSGATGRIDMKDDVVTLTFAYRGHLSW